MRKFLTTLVALLVLVGFVIANSDRPEEILERFLKFSATFSGQQDGHDRPSLPVHDERSIAIGSFNIQVFGRSKLNKPNVVEVLAAVVRQFDVIAIQELRSKDKDVIPQFLSVVNSDGSQYESVIGPRLGRSVSKEQYVFLYDASRIELIRGTVYTINDRKDLLHREPLVASFRVVRRTTDSPFTFTLINIHTDPDETDQELNVLDDVVRAVEQAGEDDVILVGDLNVDENHLGELGELPNITHVITGVPTNTRGTKTYDNIVFNRAATVEYTGQSGVLNLMTEFQLSEKQALQVSDHFPVWAVFDSREGGRSMKTGTQQANRPTGTVVE